MNQRGEHNACGWNDVEELLVAFARQDLEEPSEVQPCLAAFRGDALRLLAFLRPFAKGAYQDPLIELLALVMPLEADRLALSISGRAWSLEDPIVPVLPEADLRQRTLVIEVVDGADRTEPERCTLLHPFDLFDGTSRWAPRQRLEGGQGWIPEALHQAVRARDELAAPRRRIREQALRCVDLGHDLYVADDVTAELGLRPPARA